MGLPAEESTRPMSEARVSKGVSPLVGVGSHVGIGVWNGPVSGLHASIVQMLPSSMVGDVPATQAPAPLQVSRPSHASPFEHAALPAGSGE